MKPISKAQQRILAILETNEAPFHFIPWGLNYYHLQSSSYDYLGRVRHCTFDALVKKNLIHYDNGWWPEPDTN